MKKKVFCCKKCEILSRTHMILMIFDGKFCMLEFQIIMYFDLNVILEKKKGRKGRKFKIFFFIELRIDRSNPMWWDRINAGVDLS